MAKKKIYTSKEPDAKRAKGAIIGAVAAHDRA
jgi:hypothetical protein